jgi:hypothetical protein
MKSDKKKQYFSTDSPGRLFNVYDLHRIGLDKTSYLVNKFIAQDKQQLPWRKQMIA